MAYEHEKKIRRWVELELFRYGHHFREYDAEVIKELEEVYAKAKAFNKISDVIKRAEFYDRDTALDIIEIAEDLEDK
ncbi:hypothetical protein [Mammaliicoccus sciuri]|uniref:hypothetical protein n=1 Tax=Mammaliicoccus sciuri TaxID=1296 RepID=UPI0030CCED8C